MAKFEEVFQDTKEIFDAVVDATELGKVINIKILANNKLKGIGKVVKANELVQHLTKEDVIVILNERVFEQLEDEQKIMVLEELLAGVSYDFEKAKLAINKPDVSTYSLLLQKYTFAKYEVLMESIKTLIAKCDQEDDELGDAAEA